MENIHGFSAFEKPVFSEHICNGNLSTAVADIIFLTKMQKRENRLKRFFP